MSRRIIIIINLFLVIGLNTVSAQFTPGNTYFGANNYIEYHAGDLPIIIAAPHGGTVEPMTIPDRACSGCTTVRDSWTEELAYELDSAVQVVFGGFPHIIINKLSRKKLDANREIVEAALGNVEAETAWYEFHDYIQAAKDSAVKQYGRALFIDLHAHGHTKQRIELGYLLSRSELLLSDAVLDAQNFQDTSSIKHLKNVGNPASSFSALLRGNESMGEFLEIAGFPSVPSATDPAPLSTDPYFSGGYNTARHGSRDSTTIDAIQFETNFTGIRNNNANRNAFARGLACVLRSYLDRWYFQLDTWDPGNVVTTNADSGPGSLRSALLGANSGDTITFSNTVWGDTIFLFNELQICSDLVIMGPGANLLTLSGQKNKRIFRVPVPVSAEISGITLKDGKSPNGEDGGAIVVEGSLTLSHCVLKNNFAEDDGGAIVITDSASTLRLDSCILQNNSCGDDGGAIRCWHGTLWVNSCTLKDNDSPSYGGGISMNGSATILNSTFSNNSADTEGGAIRNFGDGVLTCTNTTFSGNTSNYRGGGISSESQVDLNFCTVVNNTASSRGGGVRLTTGGDCTLKNTLIANNSGSSRPDMYQFSGIFTSLGHNFVGDSTGSSINIMSSDQLGNTLSPLNPMVSTLALNGGNTETIALLVGSPCIDAGDSALAPLTDQTGKPRITNQIPDIGAFEFQLATHLVTDMLYLKENQMKVYPNPANQEITIELGTPTNGILVIREMLGKVIFREKLTNNRLKKLNVSNYPQGVYWVQIDGDLSISQKFIVK